MPKKKKKNAARDEVIDPELVVSGEDVKKEKLTNKIVRKNLKLYGHYTIEDRAICKVFDGLNPSQRRILWALWSLKRTSSAVPSKCATVVGKVIGEFHPHGDQSVYETLVKLGWKRYPLVQRHGNFGNTQGLEADPPAAMRYTETRLSSFGDRFFDDIGVIPLVKSFTDEHEEPEVLPSRVPIALVNGSAGIALGLSPSIPPHNLKEIIDACKHLVEHPDCGVLDLVKFIKGPDYGPNTGRIISPKKELQAMYVAGWGRVKYQCDYTIETGSKSSKLVITGKPPGFKTNELVTVTKALQEKKLIEAAANDDSSLEQPVRITIEFKDWAVVRDRILPLLSTSQSYRFYSLDVDKNPRRYDLKHFLEEFVEFRRVIETAVLKKEKEVTLKKLGTEEAKLAAILNIDLVVNIMKTSKKVEVALEKLCKGLKIKPWQAEVILNSQIRSLMNLHRETVEGRIKDLKGVLKRIENDLGNINGVIIRRLDEMLKYADPRGTAIGKNSEPTAEMESTQSSFKWLAITDKGKVERFEQLPLKSKAAWNYASFDRVGDPMFVATSNNDGLIESVSYLDKLNLKGGVVIGACASSLYPVALVVTTLGNYCAIDLQSRSKKGRIKLFRNLEKNENIGWAFGVGPKDTIVVMYETGDVEELQLKQLRVGRPNVNPRPLSKEYEDTKVLQVIIKRKNTVLSTHTGEEMGSGAVLDPKSRLLAIGQSNIVVFSGGKREVVPNFDVLDLLEQHKKEVVTVIPLPKAKKQK